MDRKKSFSRYLWMFALALLLGLFMPVNAQQLITTDSIEVVGQRAVVDFRVVNKEKIKKIKNQKEFQYKEEEKANLSWWERLLNWLFSQTDQTVKEVLNPNVWKYPLYVILVGLVVFFIFKLFRVKFSALFGKQKVANPEDDINIYSDNVHEMNLETLVSKAIEAKDYRLAVRYLYLRNLKHLSDTDKIMWSPNKTNMKYYHEIKDADLRKSFLQTALIFDYVWYGELKLSQQEFEVAHAELDNFDKMIDDER